MTRRKVVSRGIAVAALATAFGGFAAPAQAWVPCDSELIGPACDAVARQVQNVKTEAEAAVDYVFIVGDHAVEEANEAYTTIKCQVDPPC